MESELLCDLHYNNKLLVVVFLVVFLEVSSLEFLVVILLVTCAKEALINEWDA
jgi:hypothetical protein